MRQTSSFGGRLLLIDNYDSFTYNIAHLFGVLGANVTVVRNDDAGLDAGAVERSGGIVVGPGPGRPHDAGRTMDTVRWALAARRPLFGVCLGAQAIGEHFGGRLDHSPRLMHGKVSAIEHDDTGVFHDVPSPFAATRYHSLCLAPDALPAALRANAMSDDGVIQGIAHHELPVHGVQFHPESVLTVQGEKIFHNFLRMMIP